MKLGDLIDLDRQLQLDSGAGDPLERLARDRRIGHASGAGRPSSPEGDEALLLAWKNQVSPAAGNPLGALLEGAVRWTAFLLVLLGLLAGASAAAALLRYDGTQPINVLFFLGVIVGGQLLLLPLLLLSLLFRKRLRHGFRLAGRLVAGLLMQVLLLLGRLSLSPERTAGLRADLGSLRAGTSLYGRVQPLLVFFLIQVFGVAFNVAVAATLLFFVMFSDLTFSWGTTVQINPERIYRITSALSAPWAGTFSQARPSLELVEATRYVRMNGAFATTDPDVALRAGGWWPFLLASTLTYGLLPRLLALAGGVMMLRGEIRRTLTRSSQVQDLKERLRTPLVRVGPDSSAERAQEPEAPAGRAPAQPVARGLSLAAVFWAYDKAPPEETVSRLLQDALGAAATVRLSAGGIETREEGVLEELARERREKPVEGAAVFFEPFEPPKKDALRFLARLRERLGPSAPIVIFLAEFAQGGIAPVARDDRRAWDHAIRSAGDPYLLLSEGPDRS